MTSIGEDLRAAREKRGRAIAEVASELCIPQRYLRAIEENDLKALPGIFFYKSFVKQYAAIVGVDLKLIQPALDTVRDPEEPPLNAAAEAAARPPVRALDPLVEETNRRYFSGLSLGWSVAALFAMMLVCSGFYAWWTPAPRGTVAAPRAPAVAAVQQRDELTPPAPQQPAAPEAAATVSGTSPGLNRVVLSLSATEKTWLSITSDGKQIFSGILEPSQSKTLTGSEMATMKVGNAGGIEVGLNGKPIGPLGPRGEVRTVLFTPENFQILSPAEPLQPASAFENIIESELADAAKKRAQ